MRRRGGRWGAALAAAAGIAAAAWADDIEMVGGAAQSATFAGYRNSRFEFLGARGRKVNALLSTVRRVSLMPPARVTVTYANGRKETGMVFHAYENMTLELEREGKRLTLPLREVRRLEPEFDAGRVIESTVATVISRGEAVDLARFIRPGTVTVLHIHSTDSVASVRQGAYLERLVERSGGQAALMRIILPNWDAPIGRSLDIQSVPQFWFYNRRGTLVRKLTERFTEADLDAAYAEARRPAGG
jgi:hypothetical protein